MMNGRIFTGKISLKRFPTINGGMVSSKINFVLVMILKFGESRVQIYFFLNSNP